ncbi:MAG: hypothetical protein RIB30_07680 [Thalassospira sp.]|uniref:hypothetical protein n=1 Tax=Thalassospira sp. TaxID=1912094 RepID=UPI0032ECE49D
MSQDLSLIQNVEKDMLREGLLHVQSLLTSEDLARARLQVLEFYHQELDKGLFYSADEAKKLGLLSDAPPPARRVLRKNNLMYSSMNWFVQSASFERLSTLMQSLVGPDLDMFLARVIVTTPQGHIPEFIRELYEPIEGQLHGSINKFLRSETLRAFFFIHNPWHQDWVDMPASDLRFFTTLLPLTDRLAGQAPLYVMPCSASVEPQSMPVPHEEEENTVKLLDGPVPRVLEKRRIIAKAGDLVCWPARTFHKVEVNTSDEPAINLRFNFSPTGARTGLTDLSNLVPVSRSVLSQLVETGPTDPKSPAYVSSDHLQLKVIR